MGSGIVDFDDYFAGSTTDAKIKSMNAMFKAHGGKPTPCVRFDAKVYSTAQPIELWSGMQLLGGGGLPVREYSRHPTIRYTGTGSLFKFVTGQTNQGYPSDGSPRDISVKGIQFNGSNSVDCMESVDVHVPGKVAWCFDFNNCGFNGFRRVWHGFGNCNNISGITHMQAFSDTAVYWRGAECSLFGHEGMSFADSKLLGGKVMFRWGVSKGEVGRFMPTTRDNALPLLIDSGHGSRINGITPDSQDSDPCYGASIRIEGNVEGVTITDACFKGSMSNPTQGHGGAYKNLGIIHVEQGSDIVVDHCHFINKGPTPARADTPLIFAGSAVKPYGIRVGLNSTVGYDGILLGREEQFVNLDRSITIKPI